MKQSKEQYVHSLKTRIEAGTLSIERCLKGADDLKMALRDNRTVAGISGLDLLILAKMIERMIWDNFLADYSAPTPAGHLDLSAWAAPDPEADLAREAALVEDGYQATAQQGQLLAWQQEMR